MHHRRALRFMTGILGSPDVRPGRPLDLDLPSGPVPADVYEPDGEPRGTVVAVHGMTVAAHRDPRLVAASRALAATGLLVVAPRVEALARLSLTSEASVRIRQVVAGVLDSPALGRPPAIGLLAASFAGGQALAAAAHVSIRDRLSGLLLVGAYADAGVMFRQVMSSPGADPYVRLLVLRRFLPELGEERLREAVEISLTDEPQLPGLLRRLGPEERSRFLALRDDPEVGAALSERILADHAGAVAALSVAGAIPEVRAPVTLVHGANDPIVPASESLRIQRLLHAAGRSCRLCTTRLLGHGTVGRAIVEVPTVLRLLGSWLASLEGQARLATERG